MERTSAPVDHLVWFYEDQAQLVAKVADFAAEGLRRGEHVIVIATTDHLRAIEALLEVSGVDTTPIEALDASDTLDTFHSSGTIDRAAFDSSVGALIRDAAAHGPVRAFGEMVAVLWEQGAVREAIELEGLWCDLRDTDAFSLMCAYPSGVVLDESPYAPVNAVCELHSEIHLGDGDAPTSMRVYPGTLEAVRDARRFVHACLDADRRGVQDSLLVVSELASNAVRHAGSAFAVNVTLLNDAVRVGVRDMSPAAPRLLPMTSTVETGRGIATIAAVSNRWGIDSHRVGKTVWAEVPL